MRAIKKPLDTRLMRHVQLYFIYCGRTLKKYYWKTCRGFANGNTAEKVFFCWKGNMPKGLPAERGYVNRGSRTYMECMLHVPVLAPRDLAWVEKEVRETSLKSLIAAPVRPATASAMEEQQADGQTAGSAMTVGSAMESSAEVHLKKHLKKRSIARVAASACQQNARYVSAAATSCATPSATTLIR